MILALVIIILVFAVTILIATNKIKPQHYIYCISAISLGLVYQTTMLGIYTVGSDIQRELFSSRMALANGWNPALTEVSQSNSSIVVGILAPFLSTLTHIDLVWIYKAVLPLFLVATPVLLFCAFKKQIGDKRAYFATLFFMIVPVFSLEIAQIAKSMVAEFFFALMILAMVSNWKWQWKSFGIGGSLLMAIFCHYTIGIIALCYLLAILVIKLIVKPINWKLLVRKTVPIGIVAGVFIVGSGAFFSYYSYAQDGHILYEISGVPEGYVKNISSTIDNFKPVELPPKEPLPTEPSTTSLSPAKPQVKAEPALPGQLQYLEEQPVLVKAGIGLDFLKVSLVGKIFRVVQYLTELLIIIGAVFLVFNQKKYKFSAEFITCIGISFVLLVCCIFIPQFSNTINMTRFYHVSLFFLAPMFVLGIDALCSTKKIENAQ